MKKYLIKIACILGILFLGVNSVSNVANAAMNFGGNTSGSGAIDNELAGDRTTADRSIQKLINRFTIFLALIAVVLALYGGFMILTAGLKEENVKKGRTIIVYALVGLVVIFLAYSIVSFVIQNILFGSDMGSNQNSSGLLLNS